MCVLYVSFGSKVGPRTFGCVAMGSVFLGPDVLVYSAGYGVNRMQVVLSRQKLSVGMVVYVFLGGTRACVWM